MKVALVYDRVNKWGGAERLLLSLHEIWPDAPLYTSVFSPSTASWAKVFDVRPSFLNRWAWARSHHEYFAWLMPFVFESFDFSKFDLVVSVSSEAAKGIITRPSTVHVHYCLTPTRYLWSGYEDYFPNQLSRYFTRPLIRYLRGWDKIAAQRPDTYLTISGNVANRIRKYYGREAEVLYPPVHTHEWKIENGKLKKDNYFLIVSRLVAYKKIDIVIQAFNLLGYPLKVVGTGQELRRLNRLAKANIEFLGQLTDKQLLVYYQKCQAVVYPSDEDFGLVPLEAQSCGRPVIAFRGGGALETVIENKTGLFFQPQSADALIKAVKEFEKVRINPDDCRRQALKFDQAIFKKNLIQIIDKLWQNFRN